MVQGPYSSHSSHSAHAVLPCRWGSVTEVCGSPAFMAPEMVMRQGYEFKAASRLPAGCRGASSCISQSVRCQIDMWSMGVTFFMVMYGTLLVRTSVPASSIFLVPGWLFAQRRLRLENPR